MSLTMAHGRAYGSSAAPQWVAGIDVLKSERTGAHSKRFFCARVMAGRAGGSSERRPSERYVNSVRPATYLVDVNGGSSQFSEGYTMSHTQSIQAFDFATNSVRIVLIKDQPWFVAADVCKVLELSNPSDAVRTLDDDEYALDIIEGISRGNNKANIVNESGLYALIFKSRKPVAKKFRKWITSEVLPSIRKTGSYAIPQVDTVTPNQLHQLSRKVWSISRGFGYQQSVEWNCWKRLRDTFNVSPIKNLPESKFDDAMAILEGMNVKADAFKDTVTEAEHRFCKEVLRMDGDLDAIESELQKRLEAQ